MNKARITYRFDRDGRRTAESERHPEEETLIIPLQPSEYSIEDSSPETETETETETILYEKEIRREDTGLLNQYTTDFGAWSSPFDVEVSRLEQLIRSTEPVWGNDEDRDRDRRERERDEEAGGWGPIVHESYIAGPYIQKSRTPWMRMIFSVTGAIIAGILLGWFVLSLFFGEEDPAMYSVHTGGQDHLRGPVAQGESVGAETNGNVPAQGAAGDKHQPAEKDPDGTVMLNLPEMNVIVLQHGVFSTLEAAQAAVQNLQGRGLSGVIEKTDDYYVYAGLAMNRDDVLVLKHIMDQAELESYIKSYALPAVASVRWSGEASAALQDYFMLGYDFTAMVSRLSILQLGSERLSPFEATTVDSLNEMHRKWSDAAAKVAALVDDASAAPVQRMNNALNTALVSLDAYNKNPSAAHLWQAQAAAAQYTLLARGLLSEIAAE